MKDYKMEKKLIESSIDCLEEEIDEFSNERLKKIFEYEQQLKDLEEEYKEDLKELRKQFVAKVDEFKKAPTDSMMKELLKDLHEIKLAEMDLEYSEQFELVKKMQPLFEYIYAKQDPALVEKYLLAKTSTDIYALKKLQPQIDKYKEHMNKGVYTHTDKSKYVMDGYCIFAFEIQEFMKLLGKIDYQKRAKDVDGAYKSADFEKYLLRAIAGAYGYWSQYLYVDCEFGRKDFEREKFEELHDQAYLQEQQNSVELSC